MKDAFNPLVWIVSGVVASLPFVVSDMQDEPVHTMRLAFPQEITDPVTIRYEVAGAEEGKPVKIIVESVDDGRGGYCTFPDGSRGLSYEGPFDDEKFFDCVVGTVK